MQASEAIFVALDFETTGTVEGWPAEPWQIGMVQVKHGVVDEASMFESLLRVGDRPFNPYAPGKHHQLRSEIAAAPTLQELWPTLKNWWLDLPLVAHNVATEKTEVKKTAPMHSIGPWVDTLKLVRIAYPKLSSHKLADVISSLELEERVSALCPGRDAHDALYDAVASAALLEYLLAQPGWESISVEALAGAHPEAFYARAIKTGR